MFQDRRSQKQLLEKLSISYFGIILLGVARCVPLFPPPLTLPSTHMLRRDMSA